MILNQKELLALLVESIRDSELKVLVLSDKKPFLLRVYSDAGWHRDVCVYIWNCTHGGGAARAADEYRIQVTGVVPHEVGGAITLLLGWHSGYEVFAAWDIRRHDGQASSSPSAQIREELLAQAHQGQFAVGERGNGEIVAAFRPQFLFEYAKGAATLHATGEIGSDLDLLNNVDEITGLELSAIEDDDRRKFVSTIVRRYRAADFRRRVLGAYGFRCAMCGLQLNLIDAAHIIPVAVSGSSDETFNGVALCKLHHAAFDAGLVSFNEEFLVEISGSKIERLASMQIHGGIEEFRAMLKTAIILPSDKRDYPTREVIAASREIRGWAAT